MKRLLLAALVCPLFLWACPPSPPPVTFDPALLRAEVATLPGARLAAGDGVGLAYPEENLFARQAVFPLPGGLEVLDPLARWLLAHPGLHWRGVVRADAGRGIEHDRLLAEKRAELLHRYFRNRGISAKQLALEAVAGPGPPFELILQEGGAASSSPEKR